MMHQWEHCCRFNLYPVTKVNYQVEPARVGSNDGLDKLTLEILTNGTIIPEDALFVCPYFDRTPNLFTNLTEIAGQQML